MKRLIFIAIILITCSPCLSNTFELGAHLGAPGYFNLSAGAWVGPVSLRLSGLPLGNLTDNLQFDLAYKFIEEDKTAHAIGLAMANSKDAGCDWSYAGLVYHFYNDHFFFEGGLVKPTEVRGGDFSNISVFPIIQLGYVL